MELASLLGWTIGPIVTFFLGIFVRRVASYFRMSRPLSKVFESLIQNESETVVVVSTVKAEDYYDINGRVIDYSYAPKEKNVTMVMDARGLTYIGLLLERAKKTKSLSFKISEEKHIEDWEKNLILLGSPLANAYTKDALSINQHFVFSDDVTRIVDKSDGSEYERNPDLDYAIVAKVSKVLPDKGKIVHIALAGLGPTGTASACHYIYSNFRNLAKRYGNSDFQVLLKVRRSMGYTWWKEEKQILVQ